MTDAVVGGCLSNPSFFDADIYDLRGQRLALRSTLSEKKDAKSCFSCPPSFRVLGSRYIQGSKGEDHNQPPSLSLNVTIRITQDHENGQCPIAI